MDNNQPAGGNQPVNNPQPVPPPPTSPGVPLQPTIDPPGTAVQQPKGSPGKGIWILVVVILLILAAGGIYWYKSNRQIANNPSTTDQVAQNPSSPPSVDSLDQDLNSTSLDDLDKQFSQVDTDLGSL